MCHVCSVPRVNLIWWYVSSYCMTLNLVPIFVNLIWFQSQVFLKKIHFMRSKFRSNLTFIKMLWLFLLKVIFLLKNLIILSLFNIKICDMWTWLLLIYKNVDLIDTNKNLRTKLRFWYKNEDQLNILTKNILISGNYAFYGLRTTHTFCEEMYWLKRVKTKHYE